MGLRWRLRVVYSPELPLLSVFRPKISQVHLSDSLYFPLEFCNLDVLLENYSDTATRLRKKFDDIFIHFDTIPACDGCVMTA